MDLCSTTGTFTPDNLVAGNDVPQVIKSVTLKSGQGVLKRGSVLGLITKAIGGVTPGTGNTSGSGMVTAISLGASAKIGNYVLTCIGGSVIKATAVTAWTGNAAGTGVLTMKDPGPLGDDVKEGVYKVVCVEPGEGAGTFEVLDPHGILVGIATAGAAFTSKHINFTVADGTTDFVAGEGFDVTITFTDTVPSNGGMFSVVDPDGVVLDDATVGTPYVGAINFIITDATDFVVGDTFTVVVVEGSGLAALVDNSKVDGSQFADCILAVETDTDGDANVVQEAYASGHFNSKALTFGGNDSAADHEPELRVLGICLRDNIAY